MKRGVNYRCQTCKDYSDPVSAVRKLKAGQAVPVSHVSLPVSVRAIPLNTRVFVSTKGCCGYVDKHLMNGRHFAGYRVRFDDDEFDLNEAVVIADHSPSDVFTLIDESTPKFKWPAPAVALPRNHLASGVQGFNDKATQRAGSSKVTGVCLDIDNQVAFYKMTLKGTDLFFHVRDVTANAQRAAPKPLPTTAPASSPPLASQRAEVLRDQEQTMEQHTNARASSPPQASQRAEDELQPEQPVEQDTNAPRSFPPPASQRAEDELQPEQPVQQDTNAPPSSPPPASQRAENNPPPSAPQPPVQDAHSTGRQRKCKDCGCFFPFVARKTLCGQCGVQPAAPSHDLPEGSSASSSSDSDTGPQVPGTKRKRATKFNPQNAQVVTILYVIAADCPYTHHRDSQKACFTKALKQLHKENIALECSSGRQLKAWCDKVCELHHTAQLATVNRSGNAADIAKATVMDTVAADWAEYHLRSGKTSKQNKKHAEIIRTMCLQTSTTVPDFAKAIASGREKHNAITRTMQSNSGTPSARVSSSPSTPAPGTAQPFSPPQARPNRDTLSQALQSLLDPAQGRTTQIASGTLQKFTEDLLALEQESQPGRGTEFCSKLESHVVSIMEKLGVETVADFNELEEGQEAAVNLPVVAANRLKAIVRAIKARPQNQ